MIHRINGSVDDVENPQNKLIHCHNSIATCEKEKLRRREREAGKQKRNERNMDNVL